MKMEKIKKLSDLFVHQLWQEIVSLDVNEEEIPEEDKVFLYNARGVAHHSLHDYDSAVFFYKKSLGQDERQVDILINLAHIYSLNVSRLWDAIRLLEETLKIAPEQLDAVLLLSDAYLEVGDFDRSAQVLLNYQLINPNLPIVLEKISHRRVVQWKFIDALYNYDFIKFEDKFNAAAALHHLGFSCFAEQLLSEIRKSEFLTRDKVAHVAFAQAGVLGQENQYSKAVIKYEEGTAALQTNLTAEQNFAFSWSLIGAGLYEEGWRYFAHRQLPSRSLQLPRWSGELLEGKTVLLHCEQGLGDVIFAARYIPILQGMTKRVVFECYDKLMPLIASGSDSGQNVEDLEFDFQLSILDAPLATGVTRPFYPAEPYVKPCVAKVEKWRTLSEELGPKVGLVWAGNPEQKRDGSRSCALVDFDVLSAIKDIKWYSLQLGNASQELNCSLHALDIHDLSEEIADFADTAAIIAHLDLVVTTCTAVAHLAGAMGKPVWILLSPRNSDYRWGESGDSSDWYPSARLFRANFGESWSSLIARALLPAMIEQFYPGQSLPQIDGVFSDQGESVVPACVDRDKLECALISKQVLINNKSVSQNYIPSGKASRALILQYLYAQPDFEAILDFSEKTDLHNPALAFLLVQAAIEMAKFDLARDFLEYLNKPFCLAEYYFLTARLLAFEGNWSTSAGFFEQAVSFRPRWVEALNGLGFTSSKCGNIELAKSCYQRAIEIDPENPIVLKNVGQLLNNPGSKQIAKLFVEKSVALKPDSFGYKLAGSINAHLGNIPDAIDYFKKALDLNPLDSEACFNYGLLLSKHDSSNSGLPFLEAAVTAQPTRQDWHMSLGWALLSRGRMQKGWRHYAMGLKNRESNVPRWEGQPLQGKRLLVYQDQGYGDLIQFAPLLKRIDGTVDLAVNHGALSLYQTQPWVNQCLLLDDIDFTRLDYDYQVEVMRLPELVRADLRFDYGLGESLFIPQTLREQWLSQVDRDKLNIGFVWAGNPKYGNDANRSTRLADWSCLSKIENLSFYSLQKDEASNQAFEFDAFSLQNWAINSTSLLETAAMISCLDVVVAPDTGIAHLAAALSKPVLILLPHQGVDFRWMQVRHDAPWYPSARLYRRLPGQAWTDVLEAVGLELIKLRDEKVAQIK